MFTSNSNIPLCATYRATRQKVSKDIENLSITNHFNQDNILEYYTQQLQDTHPFQVYIKKKKTNYTLGHKRKISQKVLRDCYLKECVF